MKEGGFLAATAAAIFYYCSILALDFAKVSYEYCPKDANVVAHERAKFSFQSSDSCIWDDEPLTLFYLF
jgi:hypothetical protein